MIVGIFLRNIKTYSGINYIPLSDGDGFCSLVGNNGVGKSSVLEALDSFMNRKPWNINIASKKRGQKAQPSIVPVFLIKKEKLNSTYENIEFAEAISNAIWNSTSQDVNNSNSNHFKNFESHLSALKRNIQKEAYYLLPLGYNNEFHPNLSIFATKEIIEKIITESGIDKTIFTIELDFLVQALINTYEYIYIPSDITTEQFVKLENDDLQKLMGESLAEIIDQSMDPNTTNQINQGLNSFIEQLSNRLSGYKFKTPGERSINIKKSDLNKLIVESFFKKRTLTKLVNGQWLELKNLSSGEKQKALIDISYDIINNYRISGENIIIGLDEPESSLHMSACFEQFDKLYKLSKLCAQVMITTHWYGFIPTIESGSVSVIAIENDQPVIDFVPIAGYRESIKQQIRGSKGALPRDLKLKSMNDFIQSILSSVLSEKPYNWIICEGSSERIYLDHYLKHIKDEYRLRIIPVGGAAEIARIYSHLEVGFDEFKSDIKGKVFLLTDTDEDLVKYDTKEYKNLIARRIVSDAKTQKVKLVRVSGNPISPKTEIEDALNYHPFCHALSEFVDPEESYKKGTWQHLLLEIITNYNEDHPEQETYFALDFGPSKAKLLNSFFDEDGNKFAFAEQYIAHADEYETPKWIQEIESILTS